MHHDEPVGQGQQALGVSHEQVAGAVETARKFFQQTLLFGLAVASAFATNTLPDPIITMAIRNIELLPLLYLLPTVPALVGGLLLAGRGMRRPMLSGGDGDSTT